MLHTTRHVLPLFSPEATNHSKSELPAHGWLQQRSEGVCTAAGGQALGLLRPYIGRQSLDVPWF
jgi:hypothetical protein